MRFYSGFLILFILIAIFLTNDVTAQNTSIFFNEQPVTFIEGPSDSISTPPPPPPPPPAPEPVVPPVVNTPTFTPQIPTHIPTFIMPVDVTKPLSSAREDKFPQHFPGLMSGIQTLSEKDFPKNPKSQDDEGIRLQFKAGSIYTKTNNASVKLDDGTVLVSIRRPSNLAQVFTHFVDSASFSDADMLINTNKDLVRIANLTGLRDAVRIKLKDGFRPEVKKRVFSLKPGFELILADRKLRRRDFHPSDGYARRNFKSLEDGSFGIVEISLESVLRNCELIANLDQKNSDRRSKRIMSDMSKMASVLNYVNGSAGYHAQTKEQYGMASKEAAPL